MVTQRSCENLMTSYQFSPPPRYRNGVAHSSSVPLNILIFLTALRLILDEGVILNLLLNNKLYSVYCQRSIYRTVGVLVRRLYGGNVRCCGNSWVIAWVFLNVSRWSHMQRRKLQRSLTFLLPKHSQRKLWLGPTSSLKWVFNCINIISSLSVMQK